MHVDYSRGRDPELRAALLEQYQGLALALAKRYGKRIAEREEINQVALLGVLRSLDRFDPDRGIRFSTFAWTTVRGEIRRYYRDHTWALRVPRRLQELYLRTAGAIEELSQQLGRSPTLSEVAAKTGDSEEDVIQAIEVRNALAPISLDAPSEGDDRRIDVRAVGDDLDAAEERGFLDPLLARLPSREQQILYLRFVEDLTQNEIAGRLGMSQMHVSRLLAHSLALLRMWAV